MEKYRIEATENTPELNLDHNNHRLLFKGESRPENVQKFYSPVIEWLEIYSKYLFFLTESNKVEIEINCNFEFDYFNSSSAKYVMDIINALGKIEKGNDSVVLKINWLYEEMDEDILDAGEEFQAMLGTSFNFIKIA